MNEGRFFRQHWKEDFLDEASFGGMLKVLLINLTLVQKLRILLHGDVDIIGIDFES